jgi:hypothetical protein
MAVSPEYLSIEGEVVNNEMCASKKNEWKLLIQGRLRLSARRTAGMVGCGVWQLWVKRGRNAGGGKPDRG